MRGKNRDDRHETEAAFALSVVLINILLLAVIGGCAWLIHFALRSSGEFNAIMRGGFLL